MEEIDVEKATGNQNNKGIDNLKTILKSRVTELEYTLRGVNEYWTPADGPRQVWVNIDIEQLDRIDTAKQTFGSEFTVTQSWLWSKKDKERNKSFVRIGFEEENDSEHYIQTSTNANVAWEPKKLKFPNAVKGDLSIEDDELDWKDFI